EKFLRSRERGRRALRVQLCASRANRSRFGAALKSLDPGYGSGRRTPNAPTPNRSFGVYFHGDRDSLRLRSNRIAGGLPLGEFTVEVRVRPEGGQQNPAVITGYHDTCSYIPNNKGWKLGISLMDENRNRDPRFFFSLRTDRAPRASIIHDRSAHQPSTWAHLVSTYDGRSMALYVDGILVGKSHEQKGNLTNARFGTCKVLTLGGDEFESLHNYRGAIEHFRLWSRALSHSDVRTVTHQLVRKDSPGLIISDDFRRIRHFWSPGKSKTIPELISFPRLSSGDLLKGRGPILPIPRCGKTICDNLDVIQSYNKQWTFRQNKVIRYQVVNIYNDDREQPTVTAEQISLQHAFLLSVFRPLNITWELTVTEVLNSSLRNRIVLASCELSHLADDVCDPECNHSTTGYDAGDCLPLRTDCFHREANGLCEPECNIPMADFDGGDCCDASTTDVTKNCFDPESPHRYFMKEICRKDIVNLGKFIFLIVAEECLCSLAQWRGIALNPSYYGRPGHTHTMIHEVGHALGLYHVFRGLSEIESCDDPCLEVEPSMETGDLCEDTPPVSKQKLCLDPGPENISCGLYHLENTPFNNFMSYADGKCLDRFTPNQVARMHCYLDLVYLSWRSDHSSAPVPLPPWVVAQDTFKITLEWLPALSDSLYHRVPGLPCENCAVDGSLVQFAVNASSNRDCDPSGHWSPQEAEGRPDVETPCKVNLRTWSPELRHHSGDISLPCPWPEGCVLNLSFAHPVPAMTLTIWVTFISTRLGPPLTNVVLVLTSGSLITLGPLRVSCDIPLTVNLPSGSIVSNVQLYTFDEKVEIDAVALTSEPGCLLCQACQPLINRFTDTLFASNLLCCVVLDATCSRDVKAGEVYNYRVRVVTLTGVSQFTPSLTHRFNSPYCGDGEPSLCYLHAGDGMCEDFEKGKVQEDCGFTLPPDMIDQWAFEVSLSQGGLICPSQAMIGGPPVIQIDNLCRLGLECLNMMVWCLNIFFCVQANFSQPFKASHLLLYSASDGVSIWDHSKKYIHVTLLRGVESQSLVSCASFRQVSHDDFRIIFGPDADILILLQVQCKEGAWTPEPSCNPVDCGIPYPSHVDHAEMSCPNGTTFTKQCTFHCQPPAQLLGSDVTLACLADGLWSFPEASCQLVCVTAPVLSHARLRTKRCGRPSHEVGTVCKYRCLPGYQLSFTSGSRKNFLLECTENGSWAGGSCQPIQCPPLPAILHGLYHCSRKFEAGSRCRLKCPGHLEVGTNSNFHYTPSWRKWGTFGTQVLFLDISCFPLLFSCSFILFMFVPVAVPSLFAARCHIFGPERPSSKVDKTRSFQNCLDLFKGDGWCDPKNNRAYCEYDRGDCCASTAKSKEVIPFGEPCDLQGDCACRDPAAIENHARRRDIGRG
uniref:Pappalysin 2 n=1 Tax=Eptatretus burgeri TaxID=7764 RepID=A0A8C4NA86_EPTBU